MNIINFFNERTKRLDIFDIKLIQGCSFCITIILVKLIPDILNVSIWWFIIALVIFAIRPVWIFYLRKT